MAPIVALCGTHCGTRVISAIDLGPASENGSNSSAGTLPDGGLDAAGLGLDAPAPNTNVVWPNQSSRTNSDAWLNEHHDEITEMRPNVLALDFFNRKPPDEARMTVLQMIDAIAEGSRYHGYSDATAPPFLEYQLVKFVDLTDPTPSSSLYMSSTRVPVTPSGQFDMSALFSSSFASNYNVPDPYNPNRYLTLCELFEHGIINELWLLVGDPARPPTLMVESKQEYDTQNHPVHDVFNSCTGGFGCLPPGMPLCNVTARIAHLDPRPAIQGPGCDLAVRSIGFENMRLAIPYLQNNASAFFNDDFTARFGTSFNSWGELVSMGTNLWCTTAGPACISYPSETVATGTYPDGGTWKIDPFIQGCGSARFPPNAEFSWDTSNSTMVQSRCENYGMHNGPGGADRTDVYTSAKDTANAPSSGDACAGGWQIYLRQSIPGLGNSARAVDGSPMKNWWPFLFY